MSRSYRTPKGSDLPIMSLRGKDYLEVKFRVVWFREERPNWRIDTEFVSLTQDAAMAKATIRDESGNVMATSHKFEDKKGFPDFAEKAETGAIGRALALCGFGTAFCADELDEGSRIVDSPVEQKSKSIEKPIGMAQPPPWPDEPEEKPSSAGDFVVPFGKKFKGKTLRECDPKELSGFIQWMEESAREKNEPLSHNAALLKVNFQRYMTNGAAK